MGLLDSWLTIQHNIAAEHDLEASILQDTTSKDLIHKHLSNEQRDINEKFNTEYNMIQNEMEELGDDKLSDEYEALMEEAKQLRDERDTDLTYCEEVATDQEKVIQVRIDQDQTTLEVLQEDTKNLKEHRTEEIEDSCGYFN